MGTIARSFRWCALVRLHFVQPHHPGKLYDEIIAAIPALRPAPNERQILGLSWLGDDIWLTVPDDTDPAIVAAVVVAHDPTPLPVPPTPDERLEAAIIAAGTVGEIRTALIAYARARKGV